ncbi:MAG: SoxR reducing system RseC family protein [Gammaproteobacteria bacterium]|nr:SoxR reducing system RseC family protein [Gammaproteobacteria bacterium]MBL6998904.1 SoxR reducing system RseC family protein [Gammaproteobacteria bacterium]
MIEQQAYVITLQDEQAIVAMQNDTGCNSCELKGGCGIGSLGKLLGHRETSFAIDNCHQLKVGDTIVVGVADNFFVYAGVLMYLLPLLSLFGFALTANYLFDASEWINVMASLGGLVFGLKLSAQLARKDFFRGLRPRYLRRQISQISIKPDAIFKVKF